MKKLPNNGISQIGLVLGIVAIIVIAGGIWFVAGNNSEGSNANQNSGNQAVANNTTGTNNTNTTTANTNSSSVTSNLNSGISNTNEAMVDDGSSSNTNSQPTTVNQPGQYVEYSQTAYASAQGQKRVLFFHAGWCPTCIAANNAFNRSLDQIPSGVVLLKTDYDSESALKSRYGITYQHTFVQVDDDGNELAKWNGGDIDELIDNLI